MNFPRPCFERSTLIAQNSQPVHAILIGGGIMSSTLATYLQELEPTWHIHLFESRDDVALESSCGWNNAGTGHSGFAELNYTPERADGSIDTSRAIDIAEQFEVSRQFWAHQVREKRLQEPASFIHPTPHMSFVWGQDNMTYLRKRHAALIAHPLFYGMQYSEDPEQIRQWAPLMMEGRDVAQKIAATWMPLGTDVNFGEITRQLIHSLTRHANFHLHLCHKVRHLRQNPDKSWNVTVFDIKNGRQRTLQSRFVFIGAGGASLKLLQRSGIPESRHYAGFPVGGQFLATQSPDIALHHGVKAYGKAETGSPPMSVPHLDARRLDGKPAVMFGPFALKSSKFLKEGSRLDLFSTINRHNIGSMLHVGSKNLDLVKYLAQQAALTDADRYAALRQYFPQAKQEDWRLITAGQRVQVIKRDTEKGPALQFGTEVVTDAACTIAALLGASPGASTAPPIMLNLLTKAFPQEMATRWASRIKCIIPSYGCMLNDDVELTNHIRRASSATLQLPWLSVPSAREQAVSVNQASAPMGKEMQAL